MPGRQSTQTEALHVLLLDFEFFEYTVQLANALAESCRVTLALPDRASRRCADAVSGRVSLRRFHMPRLRSPANLLMVRELLRIIRAAKPHVVHQLAWNPWFNLALPLLRGPAFVTTIHDVHRHPGDRASVVALQDRQWRRADRVIVHAESVGRQLAQTARLPAERVRVIPIGAYQLYRDWADPSVHERENTVLFFGRIWEYKGLRYLIEAEPLISEQVPDARIVIAGEGEPFDAYERLMVHPGRFVVHNRRIPDELVTRLFQEASVIALPYVEASQSAVAALALAFGKPVVATAVGGIAEVVRHGETGCLVPPRDARRLAEAIVSLLKNPTERERMGRRALELARSDLSWSAVARQTLAAYQSAVAARA